MALIALLGVAGCHDSAEVQTAGTLRPAGPAGPGDDLRALGYAGAEEPAEGAPPPSLTHDGPASAGALCTQDEQNTVVLVAKDGVVLRRLPVPQRTRLELAERLPDGGLATLSVDEGVTVLAPDGEVRWSADLPAHHDFAPLEDGRLLVCTHEEREYHGRRVRFDSLTVVGADRTPETVWSSWTAREALLERCPPSPLDAPAEGAPTGVVYDRFHLNAVEVLGDSRLGRRDGRFREGNVLLGLRNADLVLILDGASWLPVWSFGPGELDFPHHPSLLDSGRVLVFDNGYHRGHSRLVQIDPRAQEIAWEWSPPQPADFFTKTRGAVQPLPGGHFLVTESERGRVFELRADGRIAWWLENPLAASGGRRRIYRASLVPHETGDPIR